jgi:hypothetical protein
MNRARGDAPYANYLPIIQSSGTGKSRTVHELARLVFTIPFNLRGDDESSGRFCGLSGSWRAADKVIQAMRFLGRILMFGIILP